MGLGRSSQPRVVRTESLRTNRHDTGSTTARSVDELALIRDTIRHYAPVLIAPLSIQIRRAGVQKKFVGPHLGLSDRGARLARAGVLVAAPVRRWAARQRRNARTPAAIGRHRSGNGR